MSTIYHGTSSIHDIHAGDYVDPSLGNFGDFDFQAVWGTDSIEHARRFAGFASALGGCPLVIEIKIDADSSRILDLRGKGLDVTIYPEDIESIDVIIMDSESGKGADYAFVGKYSANFGDSV